MKPQKKYNSLPALANRRFDSDFNEESDTPYICRCACTFFVQEPIVTHSMFDGS